MKRLSISTIAAVSLLVLGGCDKGSSGGGAASASASAPKPAAAASSAPAPAANLPVKGPWEAIKITFTKKDPDGSPHFKVENTGSKTVTVIFIDYWAYDAKGNQVAHKDLGFNRSLKGGESDEISTSGVKEADSWEATYHGIQFDGDAKPTMDDKRAPAKRAKGAP